MGELARAEESKFSTSAVVDDGAIPQVDLQSVISDLRPFACSQRSAERALVLQALLGERIIGLLGTRIAERPASIRCSVERLGSSSTGSSWVARKRRFSLRILPYRIASREAGQPPLPQVGPERQTREYYFVDLLGSTISSA